MAESKPSQSYLDKLASLKNFLPFLEKMISTLVDPSQENQLNKIKTIMGIIQGKKNVTVDQLLLLEKVVHKLYEQKEKKNPKELADQKPGSSVASTSSAKTQDPTLSSTTTSTTSKMILTREPAFNPMPIKSLSTVHVPPKRISPPVSTKRYVGSSGRYSPSRYDTNARHSPQPTSNRYDNGGRYDQRYDSRYDSNRDGSYRRSSPAAKKYEPQSSATSRLGPIVAANNTHRNLIITSKRSDSDSSLRSVAIVGSVKKYDDRGRDYDRNDNRNRIRNSDHSRSRERSYSSDRFSPISNSMRKSDTYSSSYNRLNNVNSTPKKYEQPKPRETREIVNYEEIMSPDSPPENVKSSPMKTPINIPTERTSSSYLLKRKDEVSSDDEDISKTSYEKPVISAAKTVVMQPQGVADKLQFKIMMPTVKPQLAPPLRTFDDNSITIAQTTITKQVSSKPIVSVAAPAQPVTVVESKDVVSSSMLTTPVVDIKPEVNEPKELFTRRPVKSVELNQNNTPSKTTVPFHAPVLPTATAPIPSVLSAIPMLNGFDISNLKNLKTYAARPPPQPVPPVVKRAPQPEFTVQQLHELQSKLPPLVPPLVPPLIMPDQYITETLLPVPSFVRNPAHDVLSSPPLSVDDISNLLKESGCKDKMGAIGASTQPPRPIRDPRLAQKEDSERLALKYNPHLKSRLSTETQQSPPIGNRISTVVTTQNRNAQFPVIAKDPRMLLQRMYPQIDTSVPPPKVQNNTLTYKQYKELAAQKAADQLIKKQSHVIDIPNSKPTQFLNVNDDKSERMKYEQSKKQKDAAQAQLPNKLQTLTKPLAITTPPVSMKKASVIPTPPTKPAPVVNNKKPATPTDAKKTQFDTLYRTKNFAAAPPLKPTTSRMQKFKIPKLNKQQSVPDASQVNESEQSEHDDSLETQEPAHQEANSPVAKTRSRIARIESSSEEEQPETVDEAVPEPSKTARNKPGSKPKMIKVIKVVKLTKPTRMSERRKSVIQVLSSEDEEEEEVVENKVIEEPVAVEAPKKDKENKEEEVVEEKPSDTTATLTIPSATPTFSMEEVMKLMTTMMTNQTTPMDQESVLNLLKPLITKDKFEAVEKIVCDEDQKKKAEAANNEPSTSDKLNDVEIAEQKSNLKEEKKDVISLEKVPEVPVIESPKTTVKKRMCKRAFRSEVDKLHEATEDYYRLDPVIYPSRRACTISNKAKELDTSTGVIKTSPRTRGKSTSRESSVETAPIAEKPASAVDKPGPASSKRILRASNASPAMADKQLKVVLQKVTLPKRISRSTAKEEVEEPVEESAEEPEVEETHEPEDVTKKTKKSRKRKSAWSSGVIKKPKNKSLNTNDNDSLPDESFNIKNINPAWNPRNKNMMKKCILCQHDSGFIINHYAKQHPLSEVYVSRVSEKVAEDIKAFPLKIVGKLVTLEGVKRINGTCQICSKEREMKKAEWLSHVTCHTGEYRYRCSNCSLRCQYAHPTKGNSHDTTCKKADIQEVSTVAFDANHLYCYMCAKCNYIQVSKELIEKHIKTQHEAEDKDIEIIQFSAINYPKKKKSKKGKKGKNQEVEEEEDEEVDEIKMPLLEMENSPLKKEEKVDLLTVKLDEKDGKEQLNKRPLISSKLNEKFKEMNAKLKTMPDLPNDEENIAVVNETWKDDLLTVDKNQSGTAAVKVDMVNVREQDETDKNSEYNPLDDDALWEDMETDGEGAESEVEIEEKVHIEEDVKPNPEELMAAVAAVPTQLSANQPSTSPGTDRAITHDEDVIRKHAKRIQSCGFSEVDDCFYFICRIEECKAFFADRTTFQNHIEKNHFNAKWDGYCYICECQVLDEEESPIEKQFRHMMIVHVKNKDLKDANGSAAMTGGGSGGPVGLRPKISFRRLSGDVLSSATTLAQSAIEKSQIAPIVVQAIGPTLTPPTTVTTVDVPSSSDVINLKPWFNKTPTKKHTEYCINMLSLRSMYCLFKCMDDRCCFTSQHPYKMLAHLKNHEQQHGLQAEPKNYLECPYCNDSIQSPDGYITHVHKQHSSSIFQCPYCFYRSSAAYNVILHRELQHTDKPLNVLACEGVQLSLTNELSDIFLNRSKHVIALKCSVCFEKFYVIETFMSHLASHNGPFTDCQVCRLSCFKKDIAKHLLTHRIGLYECVYCLYGTNNIHNMRLHMCNIHPSKLLYVCVRLNKATDKVAIAQNTVESTVLAHIGMTVNEELFRKCQFSNDELNHKTPDLASNTDLVLMKRLSSIRNSYASTIKITSVSSLPGGVMVKGTKSNIYNETNENLPGILSLSELELNCASIANNLDENNLEIASRHYEHDKIGEIIEQVPIPATPSPATTPTPTQTSAGGAPSPLSSLQALQVRLNQQNAQLINQPVPPPKQKMQNTYTPSPAPPKVVMKTFTPATKGVSFKTLIASNQNKAPPIQPLRSAVQKVVVSSAAPSTAFQMPVISNVTTLNVANEPNPSPAPVEETMMPIISAVESYSPEQQPAIKMPLISNVTSLHFTNDQTPESSMMPIITGVSSLNESQILPATSSAADAANDFVISNVQSWSQDQSQSIMITNVQSWNSTDQSNQSGFGPIMITNVQSLHNVDQPAEPEPESSMPANIPSAAETSKVDNSFPTISSVCSLNENSLAPVILSNIIISNVSAASSPIPKDVTTIEPIVPEEISQPPAIPAVIIEKLQLPSQDQEEIDRIALEIVNDSGLDGEELYKCGFKTCNTSCSDAKLFNVHLLKHAAVGTEFTCYHCSLKFKNIVSLKYHIKMHGRKRFLCFFCDFKHALMHYVTKHINEVHRVTQFRQHPLNPERIDQNKDIFLVCPSSLGLNQLKMFCTNFKKIYEHRMKEKITKEKTHYAPEEIDMLPTNAIFTHTIFCSECNYSTKVKSNMFRHLQMHTKDCNVSKIDPVNPVPCLDNNEKHFDKMWNFSASSIEAGGSVAATSGGSAGATKPDSVGNIPAYVPEHKRFVCGAKNCAYLTIDETMFSSHIKTLHEAEKNYKCPHCLIVVSPGSLVINKIFSHLKLHDNKLFKCTKCDDFFHYTKSLMEKHLTEAHPKQSVAMQVIRDSSVGISLSSSNVSISTTSGSSPSSSTSEFKWKCEICQEKAATKTDIGAHLKSAHSYSYQYRCGLCKYTCSKKNSFEQHFNKRHPDKSVVIVTRFNKIKESESIDTTPLWSRNANKTKHIRGIFFEDNDDNDDDNSTDQSHKAKEDDEEDNEVIEVNSEDEKSASDDDKIDKSYRPGARSGTTPAKRKKRRQSMFVGGSYEEAEIEIPALKKPNNSSSPVDPLLTDDSQLPDKSSSAKRKLDDAGQNQKSKQQKQDDTDKQVDASNSCKLFSCGYKDCKFSDDSATFIKRHYGIAHHSNQFSIIRNTPVSDFFDQPTPPYQPTPPNQMAVTQPHQDEMTFCNPDESEFLRYACYHCEKKCTSISEVKQHWVNTHQNSSYLEPAPFLFRVIKLVICYHCNRMGSLFEIKKHSMQAHLNDDFACLDSRNPIKCGECYFEASFNRSDVLTHFKNTHNKKQSTDQFQQEPNDHITQQFMDTIVNLNRILLKCPKCNYSDGEKFNMDSHFIEKHGGVTTSYQTIENNINPIYGCNLCKERSTELTEIAKHYSRRHLTLYNCLYCDKEFKYVKMVRLHQKVMHGAEQELLLYRKASAKVQVDKFQHIQLIFPNGFVITAGETCHTIYRISNFALKFLKDFIEDEYVLNNFYNYTGTEEFSHYGEPKNHIDDLSKIVVRTSMHSDAVSFVNYSLCTALFPKLKLRKCH